MNYHIVKNKIKDYVKQYEQASAQAVIIKDLKRLFQNAWNSMPDTEKNNQIAIKRKGIKERFTPGMMDLQQEMIKAKDKDLTDIAHHRQIRESGFELVKRFASQHGISEELANSYMDDEVRKVNSNLDANNHINKDLDDLVKSVSFSDMFNKANGN